MSFKVSKDALVSMIEKLGGYFNESLSETSKYNFLKKMKDTTGFEHETADNLKSCMDYLLHTFKSCRTSGNYSWEFYKIAEKAYEKANTKTRTANLPKRTRNDSIIEVDTPDRKKVRRESSDDPSNKYVKEADLQKMTETLSNKLQEMQQQQEKIEKNNDKIDKRVSEMYALMKTQLDEQKEMNKTLNELLTATKSELGALKVQYDSLLNKSSTLELKQ